MKTTNEQIESEIYDTIMCVERFIASENGNEVAGRKLDTVEAWQEVKERIQALLTNQREALIEEINQHLIDFPMYSKLANPDLIKRSEFSYYLSQLKEKE